MTVNPTEVTEGVTVKPAEVTENLTKIEEAVLESIEHSRYREMGEISLINNRKVQTLSELLKQWGIETDYFVESSKIQKGL